MFTTDTHRLALRRALLPAAAAALALAVPLAGSASAQRFDYDDTSRYDRFDRDPYSDYGDSGMGYERGTDLYYDDYGSGRFDPYSGLPSGSRSALERRTRGWGVDRGWQETGFDPARMGFDEPSQFGDRFDRRFGGARRTRLNQGDRFDRFGRSRFDSRFGTGQRTRLNQGDRFDQFGRSRFDSRFGAGQRTRFDHGDRFDRSGRSRFDQRFDDRRFGSQRFDDRGGGSQRFDNQQRFDNRGFDNTRSFGNRGFGGQRSFGSRSGSRGMSGSTGGIGSGRFGGSSRD